jgi:hypothetical protein
VAQVNDHLIVDFVAIALARQYDTAALDQIAQAIKPRT